MSFHNHRHTSAVGVRLLEDFSASPITSKLLEVGFLFAQLSLPLVLVLLLLLSRDRACSVRARRGRFGGGRLVGEGKLVTGRL